MDNTGAKPLVDCPSGAIDNVGRSEKLWIGSYRCLPQPEKSGTRILGVGNVFRRLQQLPPGLPIFPAPFYPLHLAFFNIDLDMGKRTAPMVQSSRHHACGILAAGIGRQRMAVEVTPKRL